MSFSFNTHYRGGPRKRYKKQFVSVCCHCGASLPLERWKKDTCDTICERARKAKRTREEQFWRDYSDNKIVL